MLTVSAIELNSIRQSKKTNFFWLLAFSFFKINIKSVAVEKVDLLKMFDAKADERKEKNT